MRAVVCGAGIAGLALAQRLLTHGWEVVVVERAPGPRESGYMIDFFGLGYDAAAAMGVLPRVRELGYAVDEWCYVDRAGRRRAGLSFKGFATAVAGRLTSILRPSLELALREQVAGRAEIRFDCSVAGATPQPDGVRVTLTDGTSLAADLLVGADGIHSRVRGLTLGEERPYLRYLGFHTAAWVFTDPRIAAEVGDRFCLTDTVDRQLGFYVLRDGRVAAFAVHRTPDPTLPADPAATLRRVYADLGWVAADALRTVPAPPDLYYDVVAQTQVTPWHQGRVVLVGDACQAVSLLAGQGASMAVAGAYVLGELLARTTSVAQALSGYEAAWRPVTAAKQLAGRRGASWFLPSRPSQLWLRRGFMHAARLPGVTPLIAKALTGGTDTTLDDVIRVGLRAG